jgi:FkbM family methyltransferase
MSIVTSLVKKLINNTGYSLVKNGLPVHDPHSMSAGFERMSAMNISPAMIIDVGAAQGTWTEKALRTWPSARYELIEPLAEQQPVLEKLKEKHPNINYHLAVAGEAKGEIFLNVSPDLDGSGVYGDAASNARKVPVLTIDEIAAGSSGPLLIKLDTHGYELPILNGAKRALERTSLLIIEVYGFYVSPTCLLFHELSAHLDSLGFRLVDMVDTMRRPSDNAFWQADAFYARKDNPIFANNSYA